MKDNFFELLVIITAGVYAGLGEIDLGIYVLLLGIFIKIK